MQTQIRIHGKRWFQKSYGNTYHSVKITIDQAENRIELFEPFEYGYDRQFESTGIALLRKHTNYLEGIEDDYLSSRLMEALNSKGVFIVSSVEDVERKKDL